MAKKTPEEIKAMVDLYTEIGVYSTVAKRLGVSASTVSKYVKEAKNMELATKPVDNPFNKELTNIKDIPFPTDWQGLLILSSDEWNDLKELQKEITVA